MTLAEAHRRYGWPYPMILVLRLFFPSLFREEHDDAR